ncbi:MAG: hypothetical protein R3C19_17305 [Planctomycetaceae bacterium]
MKSAARSFNDNRRERLFPTAVRRMESAAESPAPWRKTQNGEIPAAMFQLRFSTGEILAFTYNDVRQVRYRDAGFVQVLLHGMSKQVITFEGRNLRELAELLTLGLIRWVRESDDRDVDHPESGPGVVAISIDPYIDE